MKIKDLSPEQQEKAKACNTPEEILELAKEEGFELSPEQLDAIAGGNGEGTAWNNCTPCPNCGSEWTRMLNASDTNPVWMKCAECDYVFAVTAEGL